jgi:muramoyltetrapeptide carboxypeptidase
LRRTIVNGDGGMLAPPGAWYLDGPDWSTDNAPRRSNPSSPMRCVRPGHSDGILFGGNVNTLNFLIGTRYFRPPSGPLILFIEMVNAEAEWFSLRRSLVHLKQAGLLDRAVGLVVGRSPHAGPVEYLADLLLDVAGDHRFPIIADVAFGHSDPVATLPIGVRATMTVTHGACAINIQGPTVRRDP